MMSSSEIESQLASAVQRLARASRLSETREAAAHDFYEVTSRLSVLKLRFWEQFIRGALWSSFNNVPKNHWLNLFNASGYLREKALLSIASGAPNAFLFAAMLRRLNDWVPQVRDAARRSVQKVTLQSDAIVVAEALWGTLAYLQRWGRMTDEDKSRLVELVCVGDVPELLAQRVITQTSGPAATVLSQACRVSALDGYLRAIASDAVQPAARARAYRILLEGRTSWIRRWEWVWIDKYWCKKRLEPVFDGREVHVDIDSLETLRAAAKDRSPAVRRIAGTVLIERLGEIGDDAFELANLLAADAYPSISERGQFVLRRIAQG